MEIDDRYLAGFFDGEGCIGIACRGKTNGSLALTCTLTNTHLPTIKMIHTFYGGNIESQTSVNSRGTGAHWRNKHRVSWGGAKNVKAFLEIIRPYVIAKRDQVDFMFDVFFPYYEATLIPRTQNSGIKGRLVVSDEVVARRKTLAKQLSAIKRIEYAIPEKTN